MDATLADDRGVAAYGDGFSSPHTYPKGVELYRQGSHVWDVFVISSGVVKMSWEGLDGQESIVTLAFPGAWVGAAAVIARRPSPVSAVTCTSTVANRIHADAFLRLVNEVPRLSAVIHDAHARDLCRIIDWLGLRSSLTAAQRLQWVVRQFIIAGHSHAYKGGVRLQIPLRRWELAKLIAVTPEHLSRLVKQMQSDGIIFAERGWIVVRDVDRLCSVHDWDDAPWSASTASAHLYGCRDGLPRRAD
jgi:CRP-like cAMP-binding protein